MKLTVPTVSAKMTHGNKKNHFTQIYKSMLSVATKSDVVFDNENMVGGTEAGTVSTTTRFRASNH